MTEGDEIIKGLESQIDDLEKYADADDVVTLIQRQAKDIVALLKEHEVIVRCKDCKWYDEQISLCDNLGLPREQTFFCADGKRR